MKSGCLSLAHGKGSPALPGAWPCWTAGLLMTLHDVDGRRFAAREAGLERKRERLATSPVRVSVRSGLERRPAEAGRPIDIVRCEAGRLAPRSGASNALACG